MDEPRAPKGQTSADRGAIWTFHPLEKAPTTDRLKLPEGVLEVDEAGSRWLLTDGQAPLPSPFGAPEPLTALLQLEGKIAAVGRTGTVYLATEPLGPFVDSRTFDLPFVTTERVKDALVSVSGGGGIYVSRDAGLSWSATPVDAHFVDLAADSEGRILAYSVPERWFLSKDEGRSFEEIVTPTVAPNGFVRSVNGSPFVRGLYGLFAFEGGRLQAARRNRVEPPRRGGSSRPYELPPGARASQVISGEAALDGTRYLSLTSQTDSGSRQRLAGVFERALERQPTTGLGSCNDYRLALRGDHVAVVCSGEHEGGVAPVLEIFLSQDGGASFTKIPRVHRGSMALVQLSVASKGEVAILGLCPKKEPDKGCQPGGVALVSEGKTSYFDVPGVSQPLSVAFTTSDHIITMGRREKDGHVVAHVTPGSKVAPAEIIDLTRTAGFPLLAEEVAQRKMSIFVGADGITSAALVTSQAIFVAAFSDEGKLLAWGSPPAGSVTVGGFGRRLVALDVNAEVLYESSTGGLSWEKQIMPRKLCENERDCRIDVACSEGGCLVGDELSRVGWGIPERSTQGRTPLGPVEMRRASQAPGFACQVEDEQWTPLPGLVDIPGASNAQMGRWSWSQVKLAAQTGELTAVGAPLASKELTKSVLLPAIADAADHQLLPFPQVEGYAAVRYRNPTRGKAGPSIDSSASRLPVEVAWDNRFEDIVSRATLELPVFPTQMNFFGGLFGAQMETARASVAGRGVYVRLTPREAGTATYFITGSGNQPTVEVLPAVSWPGGPDQADGWLAGTALVQGVDEEWVRGGDDHFAFLSFAGLRAAVFASEFSSHGRPQSLHPYLLGHLSGERSAYAQRVSIGYLDKALGFISAQVNVDGPGHRAVFVPLAGNPPLGRPVPVPLQNDLGPKLEACSADQRLKTPRVVAPAEPEVTRKVRVDLGSGRTVELEADEAVLFGTPELPCVGAFDARSPGASPTETAYFALVSPAGVSWLFQREMTTAGQPLISTRPLSCQSEGG